jgi:hypothetical protein
MTDHVRKQLRDQVAVLVTGLTTYAVNVYKNRKYPVDESELPCLIVQTGDEEVEILTVDYPAQQLRREQLIISVIVVATSGIDDMLDEICKDIEIALAGNVSLAKNFKLDSTSGIEPNIVGEKPVGVVDMRFMAEIYTLENAPFTAL